MPEEGLAFLISLSRDASPHLAGTRGWVPSDRDVFFAVRSVALLDAAGTQCKVLACPDVCCATRSPTSRLCLRTTRARAPWSVTMLCALTTVWRKRYT